jgi:hypothetical protein
MNDDELWRAWEEAVVAYSDAHVRAATQEDVKISYKDITPVGWLLLWLDASWMKELILTKLKDDENRQAFVWTSDSGQETPSRVMLVQLIHSTNLQANPVAYIFWRNQRFPLLGA